MPSASPRHPLSHSWRARIAEEHIGSYDDEREAARAYDRKARKRGWATNFGTDGDEDADEDEVVDVVDAVGTTDAAASVAADAGTAAAMAIDASQTNKRARPQTGENNRNNAEEEEGPVLVSTGKKRGVPVQKAIGVGSLVSVDNKAYSGYMYRVSAYVGSETVGWRMAVLQFVSYNGPKAAAAVADDAEVPERYLRPPEGKVWVNASGGVAIKEEEGGEEEDDDEEEEEEEESEVKWKHLSDVIREREMEVQAQHAPVAASAAAAASAPLIADRAKRKSHELGNLQPFNSAGSAKAWDEPRPRRNP